MFGEEMLVVPLQGRTGQVLEIDAQRSLMGVSRSVAWLLRTHRASSVRRPRWGAAGRSALDPMALHPTIDRDSLTAEPVAKCPGSLDKNGGKGGRRSEWYSGS